MDKIDVPKIKNSQKWANFLKQSSQILFLILVVIFVINSFTAKSKKNILTISQLAQKINNNEIAKIDTTATDIIATAADKKTVFFVSKEPNVSVVETLKNFGVTEQALQSVDINVNNSNFWEIVSTLLQIILPLGLMFFLFRSLTKQTEKGAIQAFSFGKANIKFFTPDKDSITFKDVAGVKEAKEELAEVVEFLKNPKKFQDLGAKIPRGVLMVGAPGSGKTLLARAVAGEAQVPFFHVSASEFVEMFVGVGASRVRDLFALAKKMSPSIIFIDEIDAVGRERGSGLGGGHDEREQTLNQILVEMDGFDRSTNVIVIAATNRPDVLDQALLRPGRFDRRVVLDLPSINDREEILKIHSKDKTLDKDVNLRQVAERTPGFSGAELANLMNEAAILAAKRNQKSIAETDILESIEKVILGPERRSAVFTEEEKKITAYHEAGHALVTAFYPQFDTVRKISIISRGEAAGYTLKMPNEDKHFKTKSEFKAELITLLGGYTAEEIIFKEVSTGAANDLEVATTLARNLVTRYGMSDKLGPVSLGKPETMLFLGRDLSTEKAYSEATAQIIDSETKKLVDEAHAQATKLLKDNVTTLDTLAKELIKKETLEKEEFEEIVKNILPK
ncbi:MAG TPA: ATP-dependent zinc metalloprotease FtsH, partial [Candidatus Paceibacterota bacterium]|nr:ATP-dependent zinc metalloprotease FtsH [Candidatus Paceibacterota bacterium]